MPMHVMRFGSTDDVSATYTVKVVPSAETDAVVLIPPDKLPTSVVEVGGNTQATLYASVNMGSASTIVIRLYDAYKGLPLISGDWFQETIESDTLGVATLYPFQINVTASGNFSWSYPIGAVQAMKFTVQSSGTATGSEIWLTTALRSN